MTILKWQLWLTLLCAAIAVVAVPAGRPEVSVVGVLGMLVASLGVLVLASVQAALSSVGLPAQRLLVAAFYWLRRPAFLMAPLIVAAFFLVFAPMRVPKAASKQVQEEFVFTSSQPLVVRDPDLLDKLEQKRKDINQQLRNEGPREAEWLDRVLVPDANTVRVKVIALNDQESRAYQDAITRILKTHYPALTEAEPPKPAQAREGEPPLLTLGRLEFYKPKPHINLGLDLRGGTQIVLQCLPSTTYTFNTDKEHPFYQAEGTVQERRQRAQQLEKQLQEYLAKQRFPEPYSARVISSYLIEISARTQTKRESSDRGKTLQQYFAQQFPGAKMAKPDQLLLGSDTAEKVRKIIDTRINALGVAEATIEVQGRDRLIVEIPHMPDVDRLIKLLNTPALLEFRLVPKEYKLKVSQTLKGKETREWHRGSVETGPLVTEEQVMAEAKRVVLGRDLQPNSRLTPDQKSAGSWAVSFELRDDRKRAFYQVTRKNVGRFLAILLDRKVVMAPVIEEALHGEGVITGHFKDKEAKDLALLLNGGALPVPIEIALNQTVSPVLGEDTIQNSTRAGILGVCLVVLFMIGYYRLPGLMADVALSVYLLLMLAVYTFIGATLTMPGIAALVLSVGAAVDANVLIFERLKEERATQKTLQSAADAGFARAWTAILDSNVSTVLTGGVLYYLGSRLGLSLVRGFAVTLCIGVGCSMFTAITVTRLLLSMIIASKWSERHWLFGAGLHN